MSQAASALCADVPPPLGAWPPTPLTVIKNHKFLLQSKHSHIA